MLGICGEDLLLDCSKVTLTNYDCLHMFCGLMTILVNILVVAMTF